MSKSASLSLPHPIPSDRSLTALFMMKSMTSRKRKGERMQLCLTPVNMSNMMVLPFLVFTQQLLFRYKDLKIFMYFSGTPYDLTMFHKDSLCIVSKAFLKSMKFEVLNSNIIQYKYIRRNVTITLSSTYSRITARVSP